MSDPRHQSASDGHDSSQQPPAQARSAQPMFVPAARVAQLHTPLIPSRPAPINTQLGVQPTTSGSGTSSGPTSDTGSAPRVAATDDPLSAHINSAAAVSPQRTETMQDFRDPSSVGRSTIVAISHSSVHGSTIKTLDTLTSEFLAGSSVHPLDCSSIVKTPKGLQVLARARAWRVVLDVSEQILQTSAADMSPQEAMNVKLFRYQALFRLRMFDELSSEIMRLGDLDSAPLSSATSPLALDGHQDIVNASSLSAEKPVMCIPIDVRILSAEVHVMTGRADEGVQQLTQLLHRLRTAMAIPQASNTDILTQHVNTATLARWARRVAMSLVNAFVRQHRWRLALSTLSEIYNELPNIDEATTEDPANDQSSPALEEHSVVTVGRTKALVLLRMARLFLQIGGVDAAKQCLNQARVAAHKVVSDTNGPDMLSSHFELVEGLVALVEDDYNKASTLFQQVVVHERSRQDIVDSQTSILDRPTGTQELDQDLLLLSEDTLQPIAVNNYAICALYLKRLPDAISTLEQLVRENPPRNMVDAVVFNLCTMYDLSNEPQVALGKKRVLQQVASRYHLEDVLWQSFRLGS